MINILISCPHKRLKIHTDFIHNECFQTRNACKCNIPVCSPILQNKNCIDRYPLNLMHIQEQLLAVTNGPFANGHFYSNCNYIQGMFVLQQMKHYIVYTGYVVLCNRLNNIYLCLSVYTANDNLQVLVWTDRASG